MVFRKERPMNNNLMEQLLNENEGTTLDFKKEQYPFVGAAREQKSELLKDIITFANAWRRTDSYILIGIEEVKGGRSLVHGIKVHLDDAKLQQFVNSKTNRPVTFSYEAFPFEGKQVGVIHIPLQNRPIFLTKDYGKLKKDIVYIRRGSSTDIADPDEIIKMSETKTVQEYPRTNLELQFANIHLRKKLGTSISLTSNILEPLDNSEVPLAGERQKGFMMPLLTDINENYYKEMVPYVSIMSIVNPIGFVIKNISANVAIDVRITASGKTSDNLFIFDELQIPKKPMYQRDRLWIHRSISTPKIHRDVFMDIHGDVWSIEVAFGKIQPRETKWSEDVLYVGAMEPLQLNMAASIFADNLPEPLKVPLSIKLKTEKRPMTLDDLRQK